MIKSKSESKDKSPNDKSPKDESPKDKSPKDESPKDKSPKDKSPAESPDESPDDKLPTALANLGNTCWLNSALQSIFRIQELKDYFLSDKYKSDINNTPEAEFVEAFASLFKLLLNGHTAIRPKTIHRLFSKFCDSFSGMGQHDSSEAIVKILEILHTGLSYKARIELQDGPSDQLKIQSIVAFKASHEKSYSFIVQLFFGQLISRTTCGSCNSISIKFDPFNLLSIPINDQTDKLVDCINLYVKEEQMDTQNMLFCKKCNALCLGKIQKRVYRRPIILWLSLNRFNYQGRKIDKNISFPFKCKFPSLFENKSDKTVTYELFAVVNHSGSLLGGHYWAYCLEENNIWYEKNDLTVVPIPDRNEIVSSSAYCLGYRISP
jgi:ubiquitin C-terminal hydrolase